MMTNIFAQFWDWLTNRKPSNFEEWRDAVNTQLKSKASATAYSTIPTASVGTLPIGSRFRSPPGDYEMTMGQVEELNRLVKTIRPLPQGAIKVMQALDSADASATSVAHAVECEPVTAASVVRLANSTAMGLRREITSVSEAVAYLGFSTTKTILLRFNMDALLPSSAPGKGYDSAKLWVHAMAVAQVSEELARRAGGADPSLALMAGLLHDIGKLAINSKYPDALDQLWSPDADPNEGLLNRERRLFQADHAIIGGTLAGEWKLPHDLLEIVRLHHASYGQPIELPPEARRVLFCVQIANQLVKYRHVYCDGMEIDEVPAEMTSELGLPDWSQLLADAPLRSIIDRIVLLNGDTTAPAAVAA